MDYLTRSKILELTPEELEKYAEWVKAQLEKTRALIEEADGDPQKLREALTIKGNDPRWSK